MGQAVRVLWDPIRELVFGGIAGNYNPVGTPFEHPARMLIMQNFTDVQIFISFDFITTNLTLPPGGQIVLDYMSDQSSTGGEFLQAIGTQVFIADDGVNPATSGSFFVSVVYGKGE
jgi:hypothetical protein